MFAFQFLFVSEEEEEVIITPSEGQSRQSVHSVTMDCDGDICQRYNHGCDKVKETNLFFLFS